MLWPGILDYSFKIIQVALIQWPGSIVLYSFFPVTGMSHSVATEYLPFDEATEYLKYFLKAIGLAFLKLRKK